MALPEGAKADITSKRLFPKSRYNNGLIAKLMLMWMRGERREMRPWLPCKHQARHGSIGISGPK